MVDRLAPVRDSIHGEHRKGLGLIVVAGMIGKGSLLCCISRMDVPLQHDLRGGWDLERRADAPDHLCPGPTEEPCKGVLGQGIRYRRHGRQHSRRIGANHRSHRERLTRILPLVLSEIQRPATVGQPPHDEAIAANDLLAVDPQVLPLFLRPPSGDQRPRNKRPSVPRPAGLNGPAAEIDLVALQNDLPARRPAHGLGGHIKDLPESRQLLPGIPHTLRGLRLAQERQELADLPQRRAALGAHAERHPIPGAK